MQKNSTSFNIDKHHIYLDFFIQDLNGIQHSVRGILDTGAPRTEFSDDFLIHIGFIDAKDEKVELKEGLQTQKYGTIDIPLVNIFLKNNHSDHNACYSHHLLYGFDNDHGQIY